MLPTQRFHMRNGAVPDFTCHALLQGSEWSCFSFHLCICLPRSQRKRDCHLGTSFLKLPILLDYLCIFKNRNMCKTFKNLSKEKMQQQNMVKKQQICLHYLYLEMCGLDVKLQAPPSLCMSPWSQCSQEQGMVVKFPGNITNFKNQFEVCILGTVKIISNNQN